MIRLKQIEAEQPAKASVPNYLIDRRRQNRANSNQKMAKILVIDDDATIRLALKRLLTREGYEVMVAPDGAGGLAEAQVFRPDLIVCDWVMPVLDGLEVCHRLKSSPEMAMSFFILLTAREQIADRVEGLDAGADEFLSKPVDPNELKARVRAGLRSRQLTRELSKANRHLNQTLQELKNTQSQLIQTAKMSSLGNLVAGVAHEINNPITFVSGNLPHIRSYIEELIEIIQLYQQEHPEPGADLEDLLEEVNLEFVVEDLGKILSSMESGAGRIRDIVAALRNFSRHDEAEKKRVDIHEGIDSALLMLQHELHSREEGGNIEIIKEYGDLPKVECYPSQLNQVFLHIINNAIDALEAGSSPKAIAIRTEIGYGECGMGSEEKDYALSAMRYTQTAPTARFGLAGEQEARFQDQNYKLATQKSKLNPKNSLSQSHAKFVIVRIADNGLGMADDVKERVFDPFFTTKPVGKGKGLGLSTSYQIIVERHGGILKCYSKPGAGTEFWIELPLEQACA